MKFFEFLKDKRAAYGGYAAALTVGVIILVMLLNLLLTAAEGAFDLRQDLTAGRIYTLTKTTRKVLDNLEEDIIIYTLYQPGNEDSVVAKAVSKYAGPHVSVQNFDPVREPNTARHFQDTSYGMPQRGWLIVSNAAKTKFRVLRNDPPPKESDLFRYDQETGEILFLCEQQVTAAILYIVNNDNPAAWFLQGHGEPAAGSDDYAALARSLESLNYTVKPLDIAHSEEFPAQGDVVIAIKPESDLPEEEYRKLRPFLLSGGRALLAFAPSTQGNTVTALPNFESLAGCYGGDIKLTHLQVQEKDTAFYADNSAMIAPAIAQGFLYDALALHGLGALQMPFSQGVEYSLTSSLTTTITPLLASSRTSYGKATGDGLLIQPVEQPGDPTGPFTLGLSLLYKPEKPMGALAETPPEGRMTVLGCADMFLGANLARQGNRAAFVALCNELAQAESGTDELYIMEKTYAKPALNVPNQRSFNRLAVFVCAVVPVMVLAAGVFVYLRRRHL